MSERRKSSRRKLSFLRSAILEANGASHLAVVGDLSPEGAFLRTRLWLEAGSTVTLRLVLPGAGRTVVLDAEVVWSGERFDPASGHPAGVAVRFRGITPEVRHEILEFCHGAARLSAPARAPIEYRLLRRPALDPAELGELGRDGWVLAAVVPEPGALQLVFWRRA
jgi:hypothetical protein